MEKSSDVRRVREQREPLYVEVKEAILELARTQCGPDRRLPSEEELCRLLGVSRATVREALSILCREGFVSKRHGIGNLVNRIRRCVSIWSAGSVGCLKTRGIRQARSGKCP